MIMVSRWFTIKKQELFFRETPEVEVKEEEEGPFKTPLLQSPRVFGR